MAKILWSFVSFKCNRAIRYRNKWVCMCVRGGGGGRGCIVCRNKCVYMWGVRDCMQLRFQISKLTAETFFLAKKSIKFLIFGSK